MKRLINIILITALLVLAGGGVVVAQVEPVVLPDVHGDTEEKRDSSSADADLILAPVMDPKWEYRYARDEPRRFMQAGMFVSMYGLGAEYTLRPAGSRFYGNLFISGMREPEQRIENTDFILWSGLTVGLEAMLQSPAGYSHQDFDLLGTGADGTQFYARIGPGIGMVNIARIDGGSVETHPGIHTAASFGGFRNVGRLGALYVEMSGVFGYFPTLNEMNLIGTPKLSVGFMFIRGQRIPMIRY